MSAVLDLLCNPISSAGSAGDSASSALSSGNAGSGLAAASSVAGHLFVSLSGGC
ncbi:hypothetical protein [Nocardia stercoris]|uniref:hypothetical protein n=1 Tax=Nocardia stercoris TaxID=2483361 RepID=UPI00131A4539|nr:hypothetical protein [Nocardia stercoris]